MDFFSIKEKEVYLAAGGGDKGENAVTEMRKYLQDYYERQSQEMRQSARERYFPRSERSDIKPATVEDNYD